MALICRPANLIDIRMLTNELQELDPFMLYTNAIRSSETREKNRRRLIIFFDFIKLPNVNFEEKCKLFVNKVSDQVIIYGISADRKNSLMNVLEISISQ